MTRQEETIEQSLAWVREARAYLQALIDTSDHSKDAAAMAPYADQLAHQHAYPSQENRTRLRLGMTAYLAGYSVGWDAGQTHGYKVGTDDGIMVAKREMTVEPPH